MKNKKSLLTILSLSLLAAGCGDYQKNPVPDLEQMRENARIDLQKGVDKPRTVTNEVLVEKPVVVVKEESTIDEKFIVITPDPQMSFNEGQLSQFKIRARVLVPGIQVKLKATGLPQGATLEKAKAEKDLYILSWTPELYTIPANAAMKILSVKLTAEVSVAENSADANKFKGLVRQQEINLFLFKNQEPPSGLIVSGMSNQVEEGTMTAFTVTVKVPGTDEKIVQKPRLVTSYDGVSYTAGNEFLELDGSRYVRENLNKKDPEYLGDGKWKFSRIFDTSTITVQPQLAKDGSVLPNANGTRVRFSFKVYSPYGLSTPEVLAQVKILYAKKNEAAK